MKAQKIKILFVLNNFQFSDGVASVLRNMILNLDQKKFDIHILPLYRIDQEFYEPVKNLATLHSGFGFYFRGFSKIVSKIPLKILNKIFIRDKYDIEVAYQFGLPTKLISSRNNRHKLCWMHGYDTGMVLREYYPKFHKVINVSKSGFEKLKAEGFNNVDYCYNIIDEKDILNKAKIDFPQEKKRKYLITTLCRFTPEKALIRQLKAIKRVNQAIPIAEYWIIGGGMQFSEVNNFIKDNDMSDFVKLLGPQTNPYNIIAKSDLYLCASLKEGFSTACQEAAIMGIPVISTNVDGAEELIEISDCGKVVENNEDSMVEGLTQILSDEPTLKKWQETAKINASKFYKTHRINKINRIIDECLSAE